ncbi:MAG: hypothetical protein DKM50_05760 [Candidatus Margulisiibacteriota bacterium]|nr:MAG: hypothetical protein A2X43_07890 [Candidatus Margulisbacteria bacterium GWD2_39_127]OGI04878.1 MAG: hypothetical protein A2X42_05940 [Candidatus Margulisbacteria bacterium GWF2_38_17]OGI07742.1 MAG: hypothetical protein A2X41_01255 [Candidatus Margulisbacteria bacterium GWE2_39_32]PZM80146.1 MAG: hypothetical protein DKM50_05760 [Candidatus Margulisiibacteriota bacterium]HAR63122.1 hypothetical protein [Candidatus Margulisiibacteriota bacterium]
MNEFITYFKQNFIGYITLLLICWVVFLTDLVVLFIFLLFIYLLTDVVTRDSRKWIPLVPATLLFWSLYILLIGLFSLIVFRLVPLISVDASHYFNTIWQDTRVFLFFLIEKYQLSIDLAALKQQAFDQLTKSFGQAIHIFNNVSKMVAYFLFAIVLNFLFYREGKQIEKVFTSTPNSLLAYIYQFLLARLQRFYTYFRKVMGGQVVISCINVLLTLVVISVLHIPHKITLLFLVFVFGLVPVLGNLISNTILTVTALVSSGVISALICLVFLIAIHKLEYFLNSKIIGAIIRLPMSVILLSLLLGEVILGVWGMMIAIPLVLTIKDELEILHPPKKTSQVT